MQTDTQAAVPGEPAQWVERLIAELAERAFWTLGAATPFALFAIFGSLVSEGALARALISLGFLLSVAVWIFLAAQYRNGQSLGKRIVGIRVVRADGQPPSWAYNFIVRTLLIKWLLIGVFSGITLGVFLLVNYLWPLWDDKRQAGHDKMADTFVVKTPREEPGPFVR